MKEVFVVEGLHTSEKKQEAEKILKQLGYQDDEDWNNEHRHLYDCAFILTSEKGKYCYHNHPCSPNPLITLTELKSKVMNNVVIKAVKKEDGPKIIKYFQSLGVDTKVHRGICYEEDEDVYIYYGVINGRFNNYALCDVVNAKLETLPKQGVWWTREQFMTLHSVACESWRSKLVGMFPQFAVEDTCEIKESEYKSMRDACSSYQRGVLDSIFGAEPFKKKVMFMCTKDLDDRFKKGSEYEFVTTTYDGYKFINEKGVEHRVSVGSWADYFYKID